MPALKPISDLKSAFAVIVKNRAMLEHYIQLVVRLASGALVMLFLWSTPAHADEPAYVRGMAATCTNCHGADSRNPGAIPGIAGRDRNTLLQQLKDFKSGARPATVMHQLARGFSDEQLDLMAGYFAGIKADAAAAGR